MPNVGVQLILHGACDGWVVDSMHKWLMQWQPARQLGVPSVNGVCLGIATAALHLQAQLGGIFGKLSQLVCACVTKHQCVCFIQLGLQRHIWLAPGICHAWHTQGKGYLLPSAVNHHAIGPKHE